MNCTPGPWSMHWNNRPPGTCIRVIVLHASANSTLGGLIRWFLDPISRVSAHYCVGKDGQIVQMVKDIQRAWHAGISEWKGVRNVNDFSIGIELVNKNDGVDPYTWEQAISTFALLSILCSKYAIAAENIVGHWQVNTRKNDPMGLDMDAVRNEMICRLRSRE